MAILTKTLFSRSSFIPDPPPIGMVTGNLLEGSLTSSTTGNRISVGSTTLSFAKRVIEPFSSEDVIDASNGLLTSMFLEPKSAISDQGGAGIDFNVLEAGKTYTVGVGFLQNRDNKVHIGFANNSGTGKYFYSSVLNKNVPKYFIYKVIPANRTELYPQEAGIFTPSFVRETTESAIKQSDLTRVRMFLGHTASGEGERWDSTIGGFFLPFCYEGETWFDIINMPWKRGGVLYGCDIEYDSVTKKVLSVGSVTRRGFDSIGDDTSFSITGGSLSSFNSSDYWKFPDGKFRRFRKYTSGDPSNKKINMSAYKQKGISVDDILKR